MYYPTPRTRRKRKREAAIHRPHLWGRTAVHDSDSDDSELLDSESELDQDSQENDIHPNDHNDSESPAHSSETLGFDIRDRSEPEIRDVGDGQFDHLSDGDDGQDLDVVSHGEDLSLIHI